MLGSAAMLAFGVRGCPRLCVYMCHQFVYLGKYTTLTCFEDSFYCYCIARECNGFLDYFLLYLPGIATVLVFDLFDSVRYSIEMLSPDTKKQHIFATSIDCH